MSNTRDAWKLFCEDDQRQRQPACLRARRYIIDCSSAAVLSRHARRFSCGAMISPLLTSRPRYSRVTVCTSPTKLGSYFWSSFCFCSVLAVMTESTLMAEAAAPSRFVPPAFKANTVVFTSTVHVSHSLFSFSSPQGPFLLFCCCVLQTYRAHVAPRTSGGVQLSRFS